VNLTKFGGAGRGSIADKPRQHSGGSDKYLLEAVLYRWYRNDQKRL